VKRDVRLSMSLRLPNKMEYSKGCRITTNLIVPENKEILFKVLEDMWEGAWQLLLVSYGDEKVLQEYGYLDENFNIATNTFILEEFRKILNRRGYFKGALK